MTDGPAPADTADTGDDPLDGIRARLDELADVPLEERPALFEQVHTVLVRELNALEEV